MHRSWCVVQKLINRELTGSLTQEYTTGKKVRIYETCPDHLQISLRGIISQRNLLLGHVVTGFTRDGKFILSYQCRIMDEVEDGYPYPSYRYSLHCWKFHYKAPLKKVLLVPLFVDEDIYNELHLLICQPPSAKHIVVHGCSSNLKPAMACASRSLQSSTCYLTVVPSPTSLREDKTAPGWPRQKSYMMHLKYELVPPHPPFFPSMNLKLDDSILINSGDFICACTAYINIQELSQDKTSSSFSHIMSPLNYTSNCFCGSLSHYKRGCCSGCDSARECGFPFSKACRGKCKSTRIEKLVGLQNDDSAFLGNGSEIFMCNISPTKNMENDEEIRSDCNDYLPASSTARNCDAIFQAKSASHTSCYISLYGREMENISNSNASPSFDCLSTAFPVTITTELGKIVPQTRSHRCFSKGVECIELNEAAMDTEVIVKQVIFDAEQFLDEKLRGFDSINGRFASLTDYDMHIVEVCRWSKEVIILINVLIKLDARVEESTTSIPKYKTGFLLTWNIQTGAVSVLEELALVEIQNKRFESRSTFDGLGQIVELRRKNFFPTNYKDSVLTFSNHTVFAGKSMKYLLHPFQPLAIVM